MSPDVGNGGFPEPPADEPVRVVRTAHPACGTDTRIRLPHELPAEAVRRVVCAGCGARYDADAVEEIERPRSDAASPRRGWLDRRPGPVFRIASIPIAAAAVIGALLLIQSVE